MRFFTLRTTIILLLSEWTSTDCNICSPGKFCFTQKNGCRECPQGKYSFANHTLNCQICQNISDCPPVSNCRAGTYFDFNLGICNDCPIGLFRNSDTSNIN